jgi:CheY-like chemotaxis protein
MPSNSRLSPGEVEGYRALEAHDDHPAGGVSAATILIADDEPDTREMLRTSLRSAGYRVLTACNGFEALEIATRVRLDLVVTDQQMPYMTGLTLCRRLREDELTRHLPIILHTGMSLTASTTSACDRVLSKPVAFHELLNAVRSLLRRTH